MNKIVLGILLFSFLKLENQQVFAQVDSSRQNHGLKTVVVAPRDSQINLAVAYLNSAKEFHRQNMLKNAELYYDMANEIFMHFDEMDRAADVLVNLAKVYHATGLSNKAEQTLKQAKTIYSFLDSSEGQLRVLEFLVEFQIDKKNKQGFQKYWKLMLNNSLQNKSLTWISKANTLKGRWFYENGNDSAVFLYKRALFFASELGAEAKADLYVKVAKCHVRNDVIEQAMFFFNQALIEYAENGLHEHRADVLLQVGELHLRKGNHDFAKDFLQKAYSIAKIYNKKEVIRDCSKFLSDLSDSEQNYQEAHRYYSEYLAFDDSVRQVSMLKELAFLNDKYEIRNRDEQLGTQQATIKAEKEKAVSNQTIRYSTIVFFGLTISILVIIHYLSRKKEKANKLLAHQNAEIESHNEEIQVQHEELEKQYNFLEQQQEEILTQRNLLEEQKEYAEDQKRLIQNQQDEIEKKMQFVKKLQQNLLPSDRKMKALLRDYFLLFLPQQHVSGDFYWLKKLNGNRVLFITADSTGHGIPGALMSVLGLSFLNEIVNEKPVETASEVLEKLRSKIKSSLRSSSGEMVKDGFDISVCLFSLKTLQLQYAGAFNPLYILRKKEIIKVKGNRFPAGMHVTFERPFSNNILQLEKGDKLYVFSDGITDQFGGPNIKKFSSKRLQNFLVDIADEPMERQRELLLEKLMSWKGNLQQTDDIVMLGMKV